MVKSLATKFFEKFNSIKYKLKVILKMSTPFEHSDIKRILINEKYDFIVFEIKTEPVGYPPNKLDYVKFNLTSELLLKISKNQLQLTEIKPNQEEFHIIMNAEDSQNGESNIKKIYHWQ